MRRGLHVSEYGILDDATGETLRCATEEEVYERLGLAWIPPELREGRGELEAAANGRLPAGSSRSTTCAATCTATRRRPTGATRSSRWRGRRCERGYEYIAITDHSATHGFGNDVSPDELRAPDRGGGEVNARVDGIELLAGSEVNILPDGSPDYDDELLAALDWVIGSVHTSFGIGEAEMTKRMVAAFEHPLHRRDRPSDRPQDRVAGAVRGDIDALVEAAARTGHDDRDQLGPGPARPQRRPRARGARAGVRILVNSDAHGVEHAVERALGHRDRAAGVADARGRGEHAAVGAVRAAAQARPLSRPLLARHSPARADCPASTSGSAVRRS